MSQSPRRWAWYFASLLNDGTGTSQHCVFVGTCLFGLGASPLFNGLLGAGPVGTAGAIFEGNSHLDEGVTDPIGGGKILAFAGFGAEID